MSRVYVPVLRVLAAEIKALENTPDTRRDQMVPLFEIPRLVDSIIKKKCYKDCVAIKANYLADMAGEIAKVWRGRRALVDAIHWEPDARTEYGEHIIPYLYSLLDQHGVKVAPVIGYDRWESLEYRLALGSLDFSTMQGVCIRLDSTAFEDANDPDFLIENIEKILSDISVSASVVSVLMDFEDISRSTIEELIDKSDKLLSAIAGFGFASFAVIGCSLPSTINLAVKTPDTVGSVMRREMLLWQALRESWPQLRFAYGDYAVRGPKTSEGKPSPHTNGKIRYTSDRIFHVARGHSMQNPGKGEQMWVLARKIIESLHFMGEDFSWGDAQIALCAQEKIIGNSSTWISIDTNHHIAYVLAEVQEVMRVKTASSVSRVLSEGKRTH